MYSFSENESVSKQDYHLFAMGSLVYVQKKIIPAFPLLRICASFNGQIVPVLLFRKRISLKTGLSFLAMGFLVCVCVHEKLFQPFPHHSRQVLGGSCDPLAHAVLHFKQISLKRSGWRMYASAELFLTLLQLPSSVYARLFSSLSTPPCFVAAPAPAVAILNYLCFILLHVFLR